MQRVRNAIKFGFLLVLPLFLLVACMDDSPTEFSGDPPRAATIQDALHGVDGNPFVFLKPPVVEEPSSAEFGTFNPNLQPVVEVCHLDVPDPGACQILTTNDGLNEDARYTVDGGPGGETVTLDAVAEEYQVQIHFSLFDLLENETYRIVTRVGAKELAFADVVVVSPQEMRNTDTDTNIVFTNDQKTVPWKVRIDEGALCWDPGETVVSCTSSTVDSGEEETITLTSSDGEEVDFHLPSGWTATVDGETQDELTISIEEVLAVHGTTDDPSCFALYSLNDPETGEPSNCYLVRADTDTDTDVTVQFGGSLPILAFCPDSEVLQAIADGIEGWIMTSVEEDASGTATRTYANVQPASDFGGCPLPDPTVAFGDGIVGSLASTLWTHVRPVMTPLLPRPLHAADIGFGGSVDELGTIFFWSRTPTDLVVSPSSPSVAVGQTVQLTVDPVFHEDATSGGTFNVTWSSGNANVASVDAAGVVTGEGEGTAEITATAVNLSDPTGEPVTGSANVTVTQPVATLLMPTSGAIIPQNDPTIGCSLVFENGRGFGYQVFFDWTDVTGADSYEIVAGFPSAAFPFVSQTVTQSELTHTNCNAIAGTQEAAEWQVRAITNGVPGPWSPVDSFEFDDCVLETGQPCFAGTSPMAFEVLPDGSAPVSGMSVTTQFTDLGVVFSYVTFDEQPGTARICESTSWSPSGVSSDHSVTFDGSGSGCTPATLGTITMTFNVATSAVEFRLAFPAGATLDLSALSKTGAALSFTTVLSTDYTAQNGIQMTEVHLKVSGDVDTIDVAQPTGGALMLIDDVHVRP